MKDSTKVAKYIELVYSEESELNAIADIEERKKKACEKVGLDYDAAHVQDIVNIRNDEVNDLIYERLTQNSLEYILWVSDTQLFLNIQKDQMKPIDDQDADTKLKDIELRAKISVHSSQLLERINERGRRLFKGSKEEEMAQQKVRYIKPEERLKNRKSA